MMNEPFPEPWHSFLKQIDEDIGSETVFHCFGGFAIASLYGLPRPTEDVDIVSAVVRDRYNQLSGFAGKGSLLHKKYGVYLDLVGTVATLPDDYADRLIEIKRSSFESLRIFAMEPNDIVLTKVSRNYPKDIHDVEYLAKVAKLDVELLQKRFNEEVSHLVIGPPERTQNNLDLYVRIISEIQSRSK